MRHDHGLAHLWDSRGKRKEALELLRPIYNNI
jgi:hypothetical protein